MTVPLRCPTNKTNPYLTQPDIMLSRRLSKLNSNLRDFQLRVSCLFSGVPPRLCSCRSLFPSVPLSDSIVLGLGVTNGLPQSGQQLHESQQRHDYNPSLHAGYKYPTHLTAPTTKVGGKNSSERLINSHCEVWRVNLVLASLWTLHSWTRKSRMSHSKVGRAGDSLTDNQRLW